MKFLSIIFLVLCSYANLISQEFKTTFYLSNSHGTQDSVVIGYDPNTADGFDPDFGEIDLSDIPMNDFEIRTGQVNVDQLIYFKDLEHPILDTLVQYFGKKEIIPKNCLSFIPVENQSGFLASINLFIKADSYPIYIKWNKEEFMNACVSKSFITDWPIATWWDIPCCDNLQINQTLLQNTDSITLDEHLGINVVDQEGDTLTMLTIFLEDELGTGLFDQKENDGPVIYPNPSNGYFEIPEDWKLICLTNEIGSKLDYIMNHQIIQTNYNGVIFVSLRKEGHLKVLKQINNLR